MLDNFSCRGFCALDALPTDLVGATQPGNVQLVKGGAPSRVSLIVDLNASGDRQADAATVALLAAMAVQPTAYRKWLMDDMILALKAAGIWSKLGLLYVTAAHDVQAAYLNWVAPGTASLTEVNAPAFTVDRGFTGDAVSKYLDTGVPHNACPQVSQNGAAFGAWMDAGLALGARAFGLANNSAIQMQVQAQATRFCVVNANTATTTSGESQGGHVVALRRDGVTQYSYKNGAAEVSSAVASAALSSATLSLLRVANTYSNGRICVAHAGSQLSAAEVAALFAILRTYLTALGVP